VAMLKALSYKTNQFLVVLIKLSIVVGAFYVIFQKLFENDELNFRDFSKFLIENEVFSIKNGIFLLVLTIFNWFFETLKWQKLVNVIDQISFKNALEQSLGALTASLLTPNRIGEYGAKAMYVSSKFQKRILLLNFIGNMMQMSVTVVFGVVGLLFLISNYDLEFSTNSVVYLVISFIAIIIGFLWIFKQKSFKIKGFSVEKLKSFVTKIPKKLIILTISYSFIRYLIFSFQLYALLLIFGVNISYFDSMILISSMYIMASIIPTLLIFDVVIKSSVAVFVFSLTGIDELTILCIMTMMWLLNFVLPSIFGSYYVLQFKLPKKTLV
jgi:uncharacterized membrane protein YbhN (UPF0104 family)